MKSKVLYDIAPPYTIQYDAIQYKTIQYSYNVAKQAVIKLLHFCKPCLAMQ